MGAAMIIGSYDDVRKLTAYLQTFADWRESYERRTQVAQERLETAGLDYAEYEELRNEGLGLLQLMHRLLTPGRTAA